MVVTSLVAQYTRLPFPIVKKLFAIGCCHNICLPTDLFLHCFITQCLCLLNILFTLIMILFMISIVVFLNSIFCYHYFIARHVSVSSGFCSSDIVFKSNSIKFYYFFIRSLKHKVVHHMRVFPTALLHMTICRFACTALYCFVFHRMYATF